MWTSLRTLGSFTIALVLASGVAWGGDLSNVTVGRFEDFTVVTLFGQGPLTVTHQIVEAKDGKPHRIVVDVTGAVHRLPQNNFMELPEGTITAIRTSQFAVSPEPVVRVVLDLTHAAAYRLESPEGQVRLLVSLPGDPAIASTWSAREGNLPATGETEAAVMAEAETATDVAPSGEPAPQEEQFAAADPAATALPAASTAAAEQAATSDATQSASEPAEASATETTTEHTGDTGAAEATETSSSPEAEPAAPASTQPTAQPASGGEAKALPLAPAGALAVDEATSNAAPSPEAAEQNTSDESASTEHAMATAEPAADAKSATVEHESPAAETATAGLAVEASELNTPASAEPQHANASAEPAANTQDPWKSGEQLPEVPLPGSSKAQPERVIDYNLPLPAAIAGAGAADTEIESAPDPAAPKVAVKSASEGEAAPSASADLPATSGPDAAATDVGSAPLASLSTLPPMVESAEALVPERQQIIYHTHGKRDPFKALLTAGGYSAAALPDVTTLRLVGVLQDVMESWGLFEDANGYGYILRKGDRVKNGNLTQLTNNRAYFNLTEFGWSRSVHIDLEPEG